MLLVGLTRANDRKGKINKQKGVKNGRKTDEKQKQKIMSSLQS
jgi:hypothetical protein